MFNFIKKATVPGAMSDKEEKERRKRDKKDRKEKQKRERASMSAEELLRLDEVRRSLKIRGRRKEKEKLPSGITADYTADFLASLDRTDSPVSTLPGSPSHPNHFHPQDGYTQSDSSETSLNSLNHPQNHKNLPPLPPKPPKRGILKTPRVNVTHEGNGHHFQEVHSNGYDIVDDNHVSLARNTLQNEIIAYQNLPPLNGVNGTGKNMGSQLLVITSTSPSADSLTDTTNSSFATPPFSLSPVGESQGFHRWSRTANFDDVNLPLPDIVPLVLPKPRILIIQRQKPPRNDFGFSLRRAMVLERAPSGGGGGGDTSGVSMRAVIFAEPGAMVQHHNETGLLPGDKLLEVNSIPVEDKTREDIIDLIKASGESVTLKVQPVAELSELSRRSGQDGGEVHLDDANIRGGTLKRSGSKRFKSATDHCGAMLHVASTFENSLRGGRDVSSPVPKPRSAQHSSCKGAAHGTGNYVPAAEKETQEEKSPFQRSSSKRWSRRSAKEPKKAENGAKKTASVSSENFSESDSLDSLGEKTKSCDVPDEAGKKADNIVSRLFNSVTKSSVAKTAKMRHLDIFDVEDNSWAGGLRKPTAGDDADKTAKKKQTVGDDGVKSPQENGFCRSRNGSIRRSSSGSNAESEKVASHVENGFAITRNGSIRKSGRQTDGNKSLGIRNSFKRKNSVRKTLSNVKTVGYNEVLFVSNNKKASGFFGNVDESYCFKKFEDLIQQKVDDTAKSEEHLAKERLWLDAEKVWLMHRGGFAAARNENGSQEPGKLRIRLEATGDVLSVDEDDIEKANPPQFDRAEDLATLRHLNESSILHTLRQRYATNLIHTYAGNNTLLVVNPMAPLAIYSEKVVALFKGCKSEDMPPHIYSMAQTSYHAMLSTRRDQSLVFLGRSGSGKTTNFRHCVQYLVTAAGTVNKLLTLEKLTALWTVLESFGNCKTVMNTNATRFTQFFSLDFDQSGVIASASLQVFMLEKTRITRKVENETTFHIMHRLLSGVEGNLRKELYLDSLSGNENNPFLTMLQKHEDKQRAQLEFVKVCNSLNVLGITETEQKLIFSVLAAIFHLGCAGAVKAGNNNRYQFANPQSAQRAATLLGTTVEELSRVIFGLASGGMGTPNTPRAPFRTPSPIDKGLERDAVGLEAVEGIIIGLYAEVFNCVASLINRSISAPSYTVTSILLVDIPGFQNPATCGRQTGASFEDLCHNYLQERLQLLFHHTNLVAPRDRYLQENIDFVYDENENENLINPMPLVNLLDKPAQNTVIRTSQTDLHEGDRRGLLWLLDEEAIYPGSSDDSFLERLFTHYGDRDHQLLLRKAPGNNQFILQHLQGTNPVLYSARGWLKHSRENPISRAAMTILQESCKEELSKLFVNLRGLGASSFGGSLVGIEGSQSLRRASSIRRTCTAGTAGIKRKSVCLQTKFTIDGLVETLRRTKLRFVHCLLPQHNAGLCETNASLLAVKTAGQPEDSLINVPLLRSQIRGGQILEAVRLHKQGFPNFLPLGEFRRKFHLLAGDHKISSSPVLDERKAVEDMLLALDLELSSYRVGLSQIFFRNGVVSQLETQRDERLAGMVVHLQAHCRGYLARRRMAQRKLQDLAVRCIQRNVRKFLAVRDWPWWRLLVRVTPLLNVHRTEEELRVKTDELEAIKIKLEKAEHDRLKLKYDNDKLESKLSEMTADLAEEHSTATLATERLDAETSERVKLERELSEVQHKNKELQQSSERLEMELLYARSDLNGISEEDEDGDGDGVYKQRYERAIKELEFTKRRLQQQHEDDLEQLVGLKKQLEKKLADAYEEVEEQRQVVGQWKRKVQKMNGETNDLRLLLEEQNARNNLLEKKQRKFDSETQMLHDELKKEKQAKERLAREKEVCLAEKFTLESTLADTRLDLELKEERLSSLQREFDEITCGGKTEEEVTVLRKQKIDCERRLQDQEEELDELAGQVQLLEQAKLRLEMTLESMRKEGKKEAQMRDEELEDVRCNAQKKVKALEAQLENEHEERTLLLREKHELERRLATAVESERHDRAGDEALLQRLKRDLKRTKALLRDTQAQLDRQKTETPGKAMIRQLRNQLEDMECARAMAVKAKQGLETELLETQALLEDAHRQKQDAEERANALLREKSDLQSQLEENEEELAEVLKKFKGTVQQMSLDQLALQEQVSLVSELEVERNQLKEQLAELTSKLESVESMGDASSNLQVRRSELKVKELESKLELEQTTRSRLEVQIARLKEAMEKLQNEIAASRVKEQQGQDQVRKLQRQLREVKEELNKSLAKESEVIIKKKELEKRCESLEAENSTARTDLRLALKRIEDLQSAIQGDLEDSISDNSDSEQDSYSSDESVNTFLANHKLGPSKSERNSLPNDGRRLSSASRSSTSSNLSKDPSYT